MLDDANPPKKNAATPKASPPSAVAKYKSVKKTEPFMTEHADGTYRQWGNDPKPPAIQKTVLSPSSNPGEKQDVGDDEIAHLTKNAPGFQAAVGKPIQKPGQVSRYGPDQSDAIRSLLKKHPMPPSSPNQ